MEENKTPEKLLKGIFYGISVGPGAGGAMTLDGVECIRKCDVLAVPRTKSGHTAALSIVEKGNAMLGEMLGLSEDDKKSDYMGLSRKEILYLDFLMTKNTNKRNQNYESLSEKITGYMGQGKNVGMIVLGDVSVYATFSYLAKPMREAGFKVEMIPGVTSFCAAAAALGTSLTLMDEPLHIIPGGSLRLRENLMLPGSRVLMKSGKSLPEIKELLKELGLYEKASLVKDCGMESQEICEHLAEDTERNSYFTTILIREEET